MATPTTIDYEKVKVLVIEDELHTRSIIRSQLLQLGVREIAEAHDGKSGMLQVVKARPHLIFCDVHMAPIGGLEFLKSLRELKVAKLNELPVIFLTADAQRDTVLFAKEHAVNGYLVKPVSAAQLKAQIDVVAEKLDLKKSDTPPPPEHHRVKGGNEPR
jgi:two-component system chemotaxis response regulator CheY